MVEAATQIVEADLQVRLTRSGIVEANLQVRLSWHSRCTALRMPFKLAPRLKSFDYTGFNRYFLTICARNRARVFVEAAHVSDVVLQLSRASETEHFSVPAYCFMPDHMHALLEGARADAKLPRFVRLFKQRSSFYWKRRTGTELWQRSYFEHALRADQDTFDVLGTSLPIRCAPGWSRSQRNTRSWGL